MKEKDSYGRGRDLAGPDPTRGTNNIGEACGLLALKAAAWCLGGQHLKLQGDSEIMVNAYNVGSLPDSTCFDQQGEHHRHVSSGMA
jgi:hypothetical protein